MCPWVGSHAPSCGQQLQKLPSCVEYLSPPGVLLRPVYGTIGSPLWLELRRPAAWQATPSWAVCRHACYRLLPWFRGTFAMVPDAAWLGSYQWPCSTAPATGPAGRLGRPSASDPEGVVRCALSLCRPRRVPKCGVLGHLAPVGRYARPFVFRARWQWALGACSPVCALCAVCVCCWWLRRGPPPPSFFFARVCLFFLVPSSLFVCSIFLMLSCACLSPFDVFFKKKREKLKWKRGCVHTAGTGMGICCSAVLRSSSWCATWVLCLRSRPRGAARAS